MAKRGIVEGGGGHIMFRVESILRWYHLFASWSENRSTVPFTYCKRQIRLGGSISDDNTKTEAPCKARLARYKHLSLFKDRWCRSKAYKLCSVYWEIVMSPYERTILEWNLTTNKHLHSNVHHYVIEFI